jgi:predicted  nucleic acid-binding Zn-ribbon protein
MAVIKTNGGYNALPISYKRGNPIPLDKSAVWYDYDAMVAYATTDPTAYVGQILSLVDTTEENAAKVYVILNTAGEIEEVGSGSLSDTVDTIELQLEEISGDIGDIQTTLDKVVASVGAPADGDAVATGLFAEVEKKANAADVYTKEEADLQIEQAVVNAAHLKRVEVDSLDDIDVSAKNADQFIYMVPSGLQEDDNKYYEYIVIEVEVKDEENNVTGTEKRVERVGSWEVNLNDYAKKTDVTAEKERAEEAESALAERISTLETDSGTLKSEMEQAQTDISEIEEALDEKVNKVYYTVTAEDGTTSQVEGTLLTPDEKKKLAGLSIGEDGSVGISGTVNAENVQGLGTWISDNSATYVQNLTEDNLSDAVVNKLNYITAVDGSSFTVTNGTLNLKEISADKVTGLTTLVTKVGNLETGLQTLSDAVNHETTGLAAINTKVIALENSMSNYVTKADFNKAVGNLDTLIAANTTITKQIEDIQAQLTWQELSL